MSLKCISLVSGIYLQSKDKISIQSRLDKSCTFGPFTMPNFLAQKSNIVNWKIPACSHYTCITYPCNISIIYI